MSSPSHASSRATLALLAVILLATVAAPTAVAATGGVPDTDAGSASITQATPCDAGDDSARLSYLSREYDYAAGLANETAADWTGGEVLRFGASGDCSLAVTEGTATLSAARVDGRYGVLRAAADVGEGGAIAIAAGNGSDAPAVAVENVGRENGVAVAVVVQHANGSTERTELTAPSGRFVDLTMRVAPDGTVQVALREATARAPPDEWDATVATGTTNATWTVQVRSRAYLDDVAVGTAPPPTPTPTETPTETEADLLGPTPGGPEPDDRNAEGESTAQGVILGPIVALVGGGIYRFAYGIARFDEQTDAIGSETPSSEVEPADWNVALTKGFGALVALAGLGWFLTALTAVLG